MQLAHRTINLTIAFALMATYLAVAIVPEIQKSDRTQAASIVAGEEVVD